MRKNQHDLTFSDLESQQRRQIQSNSQRLQIPKDTRNFRRTTVHNLVPHDPLVARGLIVNLPYWRDLSPIDRVPRDMHKACVHVFPTFVLVPDSLLIQHVLPRREGLF